MHTLTRSPGASRAEAPPAGEGMPGLLFADLFPAGDSGSEAEDAQEDTPSKSHSDVIRRSGLSRRSGSGQRGSKSRGPDPDAQPRGVAASPLQLSFGEGEARGLLSPGGDGRRQGGSSASRLGECPQNLPPQLVSGMTPRSVSAYGSANSVDWGVVEGARAAGSLTESRKPGVGSMKGDDGAFNQAKIDQVSRRGNLGGTLV